MTTAAMIPTSVLERLPRYLRVLERLDCPEATPTITSHQLAELTNMKAPLVRRDLRTLGGVGKRGSGYGVSNLSRKLADLVGADTRCRVVIIGTVPEMVFGEDHFLMSGQCDLVARFATCADAGPSEPGARDASEIVPFLAVQPVDIVVIGESVSDPQASAEVAYLHGVRCILNCSRTTLNVPSGIVVHNTHPATALQSLALKARLGSRRFGPGHTRAASA